MKPATKPCWKFKGKSAEKERNSGPYNNADGLRQLKNNINLVKRKDTEVFKTTIHSKEHLKVALLGMERKFC